MPETPTFGRYAEIPYEQMTPEQQAGYRSLIETRGRLPGPNKIYVHRIGFFIFPVSEVLMTQGGKRRVRDTRGQADEGWTTRMRCGTTAVPQICDSLNSVRPHACSTLAGLERLQADFC